MKREEATRKAKRGKEEEMGEEIGEKHIRGGDQRGRNESRQDENRGDEMRGGKGGEGMEERKRGDEREGRIESRDR